jgi:hypothetical protein
MRRAVSAYNVMSPADPFKAAEAVMTDELPEPQCGRPDIEPILANRVEGVAKSILSAMHLGCLAS